MAEGFLTGRCYLVIDDEPPIVQMLCDLIEPMQATVIGLTSFNPHGARFGNGPDAIFIDLMLTGSMNGVELAAAMKRQGYAGPIIAMSASDQMIDLSKQYGTLFAGYLRKPLDFDIDELYAILLNPPHAVAAVA